MSEEMWLAMWKVHHPWRNSAPKPEDRPDAYEDMKERIGEYLEVATPYIRASMRRDILAEVHRAKLGSYTEPVIVQLIERVKRWTS